MADLVTDPNDPRLGHGGDTKPGPQNAAYLILSAEERAKGFVRPVRRSYQHVGPPRPQYPLRDLTEGEKAMYSKYEYIRYEEYPEGSHGSALGKFWTQRELDNKGCKGVTRMGQELAETYARNPKFYGSTYCVHCMMHLPVAEFVWVDDGERVGS